jgi:hypothetical protein
MPGRGRGRGGIGADVPGAYAAPEQVPPPVRRMRASYCTVRLTVPVTTVEPEVPVTVMT